LAVDFVGLPYWNDEHNDTQQMLKTNSGNNNIAMTVGVLVVDNGNDFNFILVLVVVVVAVAAVVVGLVINFFIPLLLALTLVT
jgi:hypothetical protein